MRVHKLSTSDHNYGSKASDGQVQTSVHATFLPRKPTLFTDKDGRQRYAKPILSSIDAILRPLPGLHSSPVSHKADIATILRRVQGPIKGLLLTTDQGMDWDRYLIGIRLLWWDLMLEFDMGVLFQAWHAPDQSYLNKVERRMAPFNIINGAFVQNTLPEDDLPASRQNDLSEAQKAVKTAKLLKEIVFPFLLKQWRSLKFDGKSPTIEVDFPTVLNRHPLHPHPTSV